MKQKIHYTPSGVLREFILEDEQDLRYLDERYQRYLPCERIYVLTPYPRRPANFVRLHGYTNRKC